MISSDLQIPIMITSRLSYTNKLNQFTNGSKDGCSSFYPGEWESDSYFHAPNIFRLSNESVHGFNDEHLEDFKNPTIFLSDMKAHILELELNCQCILFERIITHKLPKQLVIFIKHQAMHQNKCRSRLDSR